MLRFPRVRIVASFLLLALFEPLGARASSEAAAAPLAKLPLYFVENRGQLPSPVAYYARGQRASVYFAPGGVTFTLAEPASAAASESRADATPVGVRLRLDGSPASSDRLRKRDTVRLGFVGSNPEARPVGEALTPAVVSHFRGPRATWKTGLRTYERIRYENLWPGVDLTYDGDAPRLKYAFRLEPGATPGQIRLAYRGATGVRVAANGDLEISTPHGAFRDGSPVAYQEVGGKRVEVPVAYELASDAKSYGFRVGNYDPTLPLEIDPAVFVYAGFIGGEGKERGLGIAVDAEGHAYVVGQTCSSDFPAGVGPDTTQNGDCDAFIAKVATDGTGLVYAGYIGGAAEDFADAVAVDAAGNAYVTGYTSSDETSFPVTVGPDLTYNDADGVGTIDAFVAKVNATGTALDYAGYIGGTGFEFAENVAVDAEGHAYVTGLTSSPQSSFPVAVGPDLTFNSPPPHDPLTLDDFFEIFDAFIAKVRVDGTGLDYCGYIGGSHTDGALLFGGFSGSYLTAGGIAIDGDGNAYVSGATDSAEDTFPDGDGFGSLPGFDQFFGGHGDAWVVKVNAAGTGFDYATYIGGSLSDAAQGMAVDAEGSAYAVGWTGSDDGSFPVLMGPDLSFNGLFGAFDAFVTKLSPDGTELVYSGFIGGKDEETAYHVVVDPGGYAYITGETRSDEETFPVVGGPDLTHNGLNVQGIRVLNAWVAKLKPVPDDPEPANNYVFNGYIGGSGTTKGFDVAVDAGGAAYVAGDVVPTLTFPIVVGPGTIPGGNWDAFLAKVDTDSCPGNPYRGCADDFVDGLLEIDERKQGKETLVLELKKGASSTQLDFGNPLVAGGTEYQACVYDERRLSVGALRVARAGESCAGRDCWEPIKDGYVYDDKEHFADGVESVTLDGDDKRRTRISLVAGNDEEKGLTAMPTALAAALLDTRKVTLQLQSSDARCYSVELNDIRRREPDRFTAQKWASTDFSKVPHPEGLLADWDSDCRNRGSCLINGEALLVPQKFLKDPQLYSLLLSLEGPWFGAPTEQEFPIADTVVLSEDGGPYGLALVEVPWSGIPRISIEAEVWGCAEVVDVSTNLIVSGHTCQWLPLPF